MWFSFRQNNSGGYYVLTDDVGVMVWVEAAGAEQANERFSELDNRSSNYCDCCGPRWLYTPYSDRDGVSAEVMEREVAETEGQVVIHPLEGPKRTLHQGVNPYP